MTVTQVKLGNKESLIMLFILFILALTLTLPVYWAAFWFMLSWFVVTSGWLLLAARKINLALKVTPTVTVRYNFIDLTLSLLNKSFLPLPVGELYLEDEKQDTQPGTYRLYYQNSRVSKLQINDNTFSKRWQRNIQIECFQRGRHSIGPMKLKLYSPLGSIIVEKIFREKKEFIVQPRLLPFSVNFSPGGSMLQNKKTLFTPLEYTESYDLRLFVQGDPPKLINWKVSAKQGDLYVKRLENKDGTELVVCLELSQHFFQTSLDKDLFLEKALSLIQHLLVKGFKVGILCNGKKCYLPPAPGKHQLSSIRKFLTELDSQNGKNLAEQLLNNPRISKVGGLLWIVPNLDKSYIQDLKILNTDGQTFTLFITDDSLFNGQLLPAALTPLQLKCEDNRVMVRQVKVS